MPGASMGAAFDDLRFSSGLRRVLAAPGGTGNVVLVDPDTAAATAIGGVSGATQSLDEGGGLVFALDRTAAVVRVVDPASKQIVASSAALTGAIDYVRYSPQTKEVWVTQPGIGIEILGLPASGTPTPTHAGSVTIANGPEGLAFDPTRGRAYVHLFGGSIAAIDVAARTVVATWPTGCGGSHGIPQVDEARGFVFAGCGESAKVVVLDAAHDGKQLDTYALGSGETILAYAPKLGHFYLRGDPGMPVAILGVSSAGKLTLLGNVTATVRGHGAAADDTGAFWVCDAPGGRLLRFADGYPPSTP